MYVVLWLSACLVLVSTLDRRTRYGAIRAEHAAVAFLGAKHRATGGTSIEELARLIRHLLCLLMPAFRTRDSGMGFDHDIAPFTSMIPLWKVPGRLRGISREHEGIPALVTDHQTMQGLGNGVYAVTVLLLSARKVRQRRSGRMSTLQVLCGQRQVHLRRGQVRVPHHLLQCHYVAVIP